MRFDWRSPSFVLVSRSALLDFAFFLSEILLSRSLGFPGFLSLLQGSFLSLFFLLFEIWGFLGFLFSWRKVLIWGFLVHRYLLFCSFRVMRKGFWIFRGKILCLCWIFWFLWLFCFMCLDLEIDDIFCVCLWCSFCSSKERPSLGYVGFPFLVLSVVYLLLLFLREMGSFEFLWDFCFACLYCHK